MLFRIDHSLPFDLYSTWECFLIPLKPSRYMVVTEQWIGLYIMLWRHYIEMCYAYVFLVEFFLLRPSVLLLYMVNLWNIHLFNFGRILLKVGIWTFPCGSPHYMWGTFVCLLEEVPPSYVLSLFKFYFFIRLRSLLYRPKIRIRKRKTSQVYEIICVVTFL